MKTIVRKIWHDLLCLCADPRTQAFGIGVLYLAIIVAIIIYFFT